MSRLGVCIVTLTIWFADDKGQGSWTSRHDSDLRLEDKGDRVEQGEDGLQTRFRFWLVDRSNFHASIGEARASHIIWNTLLPWSVFQASIPCPHSPLGERPWLSDQIRFKPFAKVQELHAGLCLNVIQL